MLQSPWFGLTMSHNTEQSLMILLTFYLSLPPPKALAVSATINPLLSLLSALFTHSSTSIRETSFGLWSMISEQFQASSPRMAKLIMKPIIHALNDRAVVVRKMAVRCWLSNIGYAVKVTDRNLPSTSHI